MVVPRLRKTFAALGCTTALVLSCDSDKLKKDIKHFHSQPKDAIVSIIQRPFDVWSNEKKWTTIDYGIPMINTTIFSLWKLAEYRLRFKECPVALNTMYKHFTCSIHNIRKKRIHTLLTSIYSQRSFSHLAVNMILYKLFLS